MERIYLSPPDMSGTERDRLLAAFDSNWIAPVGPEVNAFEDDLCAFTGATAAAALSSGTAALHLALLLVGVGPGDEVIMPTLTFVAPANAALYVGARPRFVDVERETWNMDPDLLAAALDEGPPPAAVVVVDIYGQAAQLDRIAKVCEEYGVPLIEDAAEALGATWMGRSAGTWGHLGVYSFNGNKVLTTSGGGALVGPPDLVERARRLSSQAREPALHYEHAEVGFNYRLSNLLAAIGRGQLEQLPQKIDRLHDINATYRRELGSVDGVEFMPWDPRGRPNGWLSVMLVDLDRANPHDICRSLDADNIEARPAWKPMHLQPLFEGHSCVGGEVSEEFFRRGVCLPSGSSLTDSQLERVVGAVRRALGE